MPLHVTISRRALLDELSLATAIISKTSSLPILHHVLLNAEKSQVHFSASNLEQSSISGCSTVEVKSEGRVAIAAQRLFEFVRALPECDVTLRELDNGSVSVSAMRAKARVLALSAASFPVIPTPPEAMKKISSLGLQALIQCVDFATSKEEQRHGALHSAQFTGGGGSNFRMVATDGHRLSIAELSQSESAEPDGAPWKTLIPRFALHFLDRALSSTPIENIEYGEDENHLFFRMGATLIVSRKLAGHFPEYERVLPSVLPNSVVLSRKELANAILRANQFSDERSGRVTLTFESSQLLISSSAEIAAAEESIEVKYDGSPMQIAISGAYVLDFLKSADQDSEVKISFDTSDKPLLFSPAVLGDTHAISLYKHLIMAMR